MCVQRPKAIVIKIFPIFTALCLRDQNLLTVFNKMNYLVSECYTTHTHLDTYICIFFHSENFKLIIQLLLIHNHHMWFIKNAKSLAWAIIQNAVPTLHYCNPYIQLFSLAFFYYSDMNSVFACIANSRKMFLTEKYK